MMKKILIVLLFMISVPFFMHLEAQNDIIDGIYTRENVSARKPVPYYHLREADAIWAKKVWRTLDLREKLNHPFYYPTDPLDSRRNLFQVLLDGVENEGITVYEYDVYELIDEFSGAPRTLEQINKDLGAKSEVIEKEDLETGEIVSTQVVSEPNPEEVFRFNMKEEWVFDRQRSKMEVRTIGLAPFRWYIQDVDGLELDDASRKLMPLFWAYFQSYRNIFASQEVFNAYNDAERRTFDDIFFKRRYSSHIYKVTNTHNNRAIKTYKRGEDALLEAERIKDWLFKVEHDFWEF